MNHTSKWVQEFDNGPALMIGKAGKTEGIQNVRRVIKSFIASAIETAREEGRREERREILAILPRPLSDRQKADEVNFYVRGRNSATDEMRSIITSRKSSEGSKHPDFCTASIKEPAYMHHFECPWYTTKAV